MVNRVFASRFDYWLARGDVDPAKNHPPKWVVLIFVKTSQLDEFFDFYYCAPNWAAVKTHKKH